MTMHAYRAPLFHMLADPARAEPGQAYEYFEEGGLLVRGGHVEAVGPWRDLRSRVPRDTPVTSFPNGLIVPGFVDAHIHYPQTDIIAAHGKGLMDWLETYAFPVEGRFADKAHAKDNARFFLNELLRNGTTCALVFGTVHAHSVETLFAEAERRNMRLIAGRVLSDRNVPETLRHTAESGAEESAQLIRNWHGRGRLGYALTPRFAPACTSRQLELAGRLMKEHDTVLLHTHLAEDKREAALVRDLFPEAEGYLDVYARHGLLTGRSVFAHCIHLNDSEFARMREANAAIAFCPTSNLFLGSGLFDLESAGQHGVATGLGTDVGAGTSFSLLQTMNEAYKVCRLRGAAPDAFQLFYLATLGGAHALGLHGRVGNLAPGKEADFLVLDTGATPLLQRRLTACGSLADKLFVLSILGDDRVIRHTYVAGSLAHSRDGVTEDSGRAEGRPSPRRNT